MTETSVEDLVAATYLRSAERLFRNTLSDTERTIEGLRNAAKDGDGKAIDEVRVMIRKLGEVTTMLIKEGTRVEERLDRERGPQDQFALDLGTARVQVREQLGKLAAAKGLGSAAE